MTTIEVSAAIAELILRAAAERGVDIPALCSACSHDPAVSRAPDARITLATEVALWNEAARQAGDDAFGLHAAELVSLGAFDVIGYAVRTAPTLRAALERMARYNRLVHDVAEISLADDGDATRLEHAFRAGNDGPCRHAAEFTLAVIVVMSAQIVGAPVRPRAVEFHHGAPARDAVALAEHTRLFGVEPRFAQRANALVFDRATLARPVLAADPNLARIIERHAEALLAARPGPAQSTAERVRRVLAGALGEGDASLRAVAARLRMSERSLQRKLAHESVTYDTLVDAMRRDLALQYLADPKIAVAEVAYLLGYSEPSPFHRAFKRWTGLTPTEARRGMA